MEEEIQLKESLHALKKQEEYKTQTIADNLLLEEQMKTALSSNIDQSNVQLSNDSKIEEMRMEIEYAHANEKSLKDEVNRLTKQLNDSLNTHNEISLRSQLWEATSKEIKELNHKLETDVDLYRTERADVNDRIDSLNDRLNKSMLEQENLNQKLKEQYSVLEETQKQNDALNTTKSELLDQIKNLQTQLSNETREDQILTVKSEEILTLQDEVSVLRKELESKMDQINSLKDTFAERVSNFEEKTTSLEQSVSHLKQQNSNLTTELISTKTKIESCELEIDTSSKTILDLKRHNEVLMNQPTQDLQSQNKIQELEQKIVTLQCEYENQMVSIEKELHELRNLTLDFDVLQTKLRVANSELEAVSHLYNDSHKNEIDFRQQLDELKQAYEDVSDQNVSRETVLQDQKIEIQTLNETITQLRTKLEASTSQIDIIAAERDTMVLCKDQIVQEKEHQLLEAETIMKKLKEELEEQAQLANELQIKTAAHHQECTENSQKHQEKMMAYNNEVSMLQQQIDDSKSSFHSLTNTCESLRTEKEKLEDSMIKAENQITELTARLDNLTSQRDELHNKLVELNHNLSESMCDREDKNRLLDNFKLEREELRSQIDVLEGRVKEITKKNKDKIQETDIRTQDLIAKITLLENKLEVREKNLEEATQRNNELCVKLEESQVIIEKANFKLTENNNRLIEALNKEKTLQEEINTINAVLTTEQNQNVEIGTV